MYNIAVGVIGVFSAGHYDKEFFASVDYLDVVNRKLAVERYRNDCLHRSFLEKLSDFDISDLHK
jgi:hypothetical protein